jgi:hypothetical protein
MKRMVLYQLYSRQSAKANDSEVEITESGLMHVGTCQIGLIILTRVD